LLHKVQKIIVHSESQIQIVHCIVFSPFKFRFPRHNRDSASELDDDRWKFPFARRRWQSPRCLRFEWNTKKLTRK